MALRIFESERDAKDRVRYVRNFFFTRSGTIFNTRFYFFFSLSMLLCFVLNRCVYDMHIVVKRISCYREKIYILFLFLLNETIDRFILIRSIALSI